MSSSKERLICRHCRGYEEDHHAFEPIRIPAGCVCDWRDWGDPTNIPAICKRFVKDEADSSFCENCEHERECHMHREAA